MLVGKLIIIGNSAVGKSSLQHRYLEKFFKPNISLTVGYDHRIKNIEADGQKVKLLIFDTSGQEQYFSMTKNFYKATDGIMLVFGIDDKASFDNIKF